MPLWQIVGGQGFFYFTFAYRFERRKARNNRRGFAPKSWILGQF